MNQKQKHNLKLPKRNPNYCIATFVFFILLQFANGSFVDHDLSSFQVSQRHTLFDGTRPDCPLYHALHYILQHWPQFSPLIPLSVPLFGLFWAGKRSRWGVGRVMFGCLEQICWIFRTKNVSQGFQSSNQKVRDSDRSQFKCKCIQFGGMECLGRLGWTGWLLVIYNFPGISSGGRWWKWVRLRAFFLPIFIITTLYLILLHVLLWTFYFVVLVSC